MRTPAPLPPEGRLAEAHESATAISANFGSRFDSIIFGDYELLEEIARGGMGVVWRARQISLNRIVALKLVLAGRFASDVDIKRFRAEAEAAAQLEHPNIVPIYDVDECEGQHYFAMKFIDAGSLAERITGVKRSSGGSAVERPTGRAAAVLMAKTARAVHYAHQRGILHRDLKPGNILLDEAGDPHVSDFGLAKRLTEMPASRNSTESPAALTVSGAILGTPSYMSPEAASGKAKAMTTESDIYSLGAILYELLAGYPPFTGESTVEILRRVVEETPLPPSRLRAIKELANGPRPTAERRDDGTARLDRDLEVITLKCLEKDPARRYGTALELAEDLERFLRQEPIRARATSGAERFWLWCRRHPAVVVAWVTCGAALIGALFAWQGRRESLLKEEALRAAKAELANQTVSLVRAARTRLQPGRRLENLPRLAAAAHFGRTLELRNEAVACLALFDLNAGQEFRFPHRSANVSFTPDLTGLALSRDQNTIVIYDLADGQRRTSLTGCEGHIGWLQFSPEGRWLGGRSLSGLSVFDLERSVKLMRLTSRFGSTPEREFAFSPNAAHIAVRVNPTRSATNEAVDVFALPTGERIHHWTDFPPETIYGVAYSPDGRKLAVVQRTWLTVVDATNGVRLWSMARDVVHDHIADPVAFSWHPNGDWLLLADKERVVSAWRLVPVPWRLFFGSQNEQPARLFFGADGDWFISASDAGETVVWDFPAARSLLRVDGRYQATAVSADRRRIAYAREPSGRPFAGTWEPAASPVLREVWMDNDSRLLGVSADGQWLATSSGSNGFHLVHTSDRRRTADPWRANLETSELVLVPEQNAVFTRSRDGWWRWPLRDDQEWMNKTLAVTHTATPAVMRRFLPASVAQAGPQRIPETNIVTSRATAGRGFSGRELSFQPTNAGRWRVSCGAAPSGQSGRFAVNERAGLLAYSHTPTLVRLVEAQSGAALCDLDAPEPKPVLDLAFDDNGKTLAVLTTGGIVQLWNVERLRLELAKLGLDW